MKASHLTFIDIADKKHGFTAAERVVDSDYFIITGVAITPSIFLPKVLTQP